jgi:predicted nucleic acid-binding protein
MRVLLDTNIILDTLLIRDSHNEYSDQIFDLIATNTISAYVNTSSITDIYFISRRKLSDADTREKLKHILTIFQAIEVTKDDCWEALKSSMPDFEDALVTVCADKVNIDFIITRDIKFLNHQKAVSPSEFLEKHLKNSPE